MPAIAPPSPVPSRLAPYSGISPSAATKAGVSLADYVRWFALDIHALRGRDVLDVAAGSASFTAEACARKINAVAVDPLYGLPAETLAASVSPGGKLSSSAESSEGHAGGPTHRFLTDYETHFIHNRYVPASLPRLPFFDGTFDVVLCAHFLFPPSGRLDLDWHLAALLELVRVSAGEVRVYPITECGTKIGPASRLRRSLREAGVESRVLTTSADAAGAVLVLRKAPS